MAQSFTVKLTENGNGRPFVKRFTKGTRTQQVALKNAVIAATAGTLVYDQESRPTPGGDASTPDASTSYSDATLYFSKGILDDSLEFEQLVNAVSDGAGGVDISSALMTAVEAAFVGSDGLTGWTLVKGVYHK